MFSPSSHVARCCPSSDAFPAVPRKLLIQENRTACRRCEQRCLQGCTVRSSSCKMFTQSDSSLAQVVFQKLWLLAAGVGYLPRDAPEEDSSLICDEVWELSCGLDSGNIKIATESCLLMKRLSRPGTAAVQGDGGVFLNTSSCGR